MEYFCAIVTSTVVELFIRHTIGYIEQGIIAKSYMLCVVVVCACMLGRFRTTRRLSH